MRIAIVGAGSWGTALAHALARDGSRDVVMWARDPGVADVLARTRHNPAYLTEVSLDERVTVAADLATTVGEAEIVLVAVPTDAMREVVTALAPLLSATTIIVSAAKGFDEQRDLTMTAVLREILGDESKDRIAALSGPNIAVRSRGAFLRRPLSRARRRARTRCATRVPAPICACTAPRTASVSNTRAR